MRRRRPVARLLLLALGLASLGGCASRERNNPFDPANRATGGTPELLRAIAGNRSVDLSWDLSAFQGVERIRIERRDVGPPLSLVSQPGRGAGAWRDSTARNGVSYTYRLEIVPSSGDSLSTKDALATPGASIPWMADAAGGGAGRLSPDGRNLLFRVEPYRDDLDLQLETDGSFWVADYANGAIVHYDPAGNLASEWPEPGADAVALDARSGEIWAGSFDLATVTLFRGDGGRVWADSAIGFVEKIAADPGGGVWVGTRENGLIRILPQLQAEQVTALQWPVDLEMAPDSALWIIDRATQQVYRLAAGGILPQVSHAAFVNPTGGAPDGAGGFWVADPGRGGISHLDSGLNEISWFAVGQAEAVTWDPVGRRLWVCFSDQGTVEVLDVGGVPETYAVASDLDVGGRPVEIKGLWR